MKFIFIILPLAFTLTAAAQAFTFQDPSYGLLPGHAPAQSSDPVDSQRLVYGGSWSNVAGVSGGIPTGQSTYTNFTASATYQQINKGIADCGSNQVVHCAAGDYNFGGSGQIVMQKDGVVLRGDVDANGNPTTIFHTTTFVSLAQGGGHDTSSSAAWNTVNVTAGIARGATTVTLASIPSGCATGALLWFSAAPADVGWSGGFFGLFLGTDPYVQIVKVTGVSGNDVSFYPAINAEWATVLKASTAKDTCYHRMGVENINFVGDELTYIQSYGTDECWVKNCILTNRTTAGSVRHLYLYTCNRFEVRHCEFGRIIADASNAYSVYNQDGTGILVEDNYFHHSPNFYPQMLAQNCVFAYNYATNVPYHATTNWLSQIVYNHGGVCCYNLYEGNFIPTYYDDGLTNNSNDPTITRCNTRLRDRLVGWDIGENIGGFGDTNDCRAITMLYPEASNNVVGCILGRPGFHTSTNANTFYEGSGNSMDRIIYAVDKDTNSLARFGNWNAYNGAINGIETLGGGSVIANSYIYASKPSYFGILTWPPVDPTAVTDAKLSATNIPAGYRAVFGTNPPAS